VRLLVADCQVDYAGALSAHLPRAKRLVMVKADGSVSIHADNGAFKPLNWMAAPCQLTELSPTGDPRISRLWQVTNRSGDQLRISFFDIEADYDHALGLDPGLVKDGVERHLQELLAEHPASLRPGLSLIEREFMTAIGPIDLLCQADDGHYVAVEVKRRGEIDGVEQLTRYVDLMRRDPLLGLSRVEGMLAAQLIKPQARVLARDRGLECVLVDYDELRGIEPLIEPLF
jgi:RecB family endonuclease NucS